MNDRDLYPTYPIRTLKDLVDESARRYEEKVALATKEGANYNTTSYSQMKQQVQELAAALAALGHAGSKVGVLGENRTEWAIVYLAVVASGGIIVPIDKDLKAKEIAHILAFSECRVVFCGGDFIDEMQGMRSEKGFPASIFSLEKDRAGADFCVTELLRLGAAALDEGAKMAAPRADDVAAIIFTSGTMGSSKAVMLTHRNLSANIVATSQFVSIRDEDRLLSVLPLHHTYECTCGFLTALYQGASIYYAESLRRIPENLAETRATVVLGVPLLFEAMYRRIEEGIRKKGELLFRLAKWLAALSDRVGIDSRRRLFRKVHEKLGGHLRLLISGGAAIKPEVLRGFRSLGINCIQGYGMTEASPLISVNREGNARDESVGLPVPCVEVRIVDDEILVRGSSVMAGYYKNEAATAETIRDGWLHTGDLGYLDESGFLYIAGRRKSVIVTPNGKNVHPEELEAQLNENRFVLESLVWGGPASSPDEVEVQAIIVPDADVFQRELGEGAYDEEKIREVLEEVVKSINRDVATYKRIRKFSIRGEEFEKTTTRKIKRYLYTGKAKILEER